MQGKYIVLNTSLVPKDQSILCILYVVTIKKPSRMRKGLIKSVCVMYNVDLYLKKSLQYPLQAVHTVLHFKCHKCIKYKHIR